MVRICFVCLGNICRSPSAEAIMRHLVEQRGLSSQIEIESAGMGDWHVGAPADARSARAAQLRGYALTGRAQQFVATFFDRFDLVIAMDRENRRALQVLADSPRSREKIHLFRDFDPASAKGSDVPDPYYGGPDGFERVLDICEAASAGLVAFVAARLGA